MGRVEPSMSVAHTPCTSVILVCSTVYSVHIATEQLWDPITKLPTGRREAHSTRFNLNARQSLGLGTYLVRYKYSLFGPRGIAQLSFDLPLGTHDKCPPIALRVRSLTQANILFH